MANEYGLSLTIYDKDKKQIEQHRIDQFLKQVGAAAKSQGFELSYFLEKADK